MLAEKAINAGYKSDWQGRRDDVSKHGTISRLVEIGNRIIGHFVGGLWDLAPAGGRHRLQLRNTPPDSY